jgi:L-glyceraldehyde 3-phosphate reductase
MKEIMNYSASEKRYDDMVYNRCGNSGLKLPAISLGLWHNFGGVDKLENCRDMLRTAFNQGITHFDLANNYGPPPGSAETTFGILLEQDFRPYRDELIISTKAGHLMWPGPYGEWGSRKYLVSSLDQSLKRMKLDYVDIFYSHRPDPDTPLEETMGALASIVQQGKALYVGISKYSPENTRKAAQILKELNTPFVIQQDPYNMFRREPEDELLGTLDELGLGCIVFCPLAQGLLTNKYLNGIPTDSRAGKEGTFLKKEQISEAIVNKVVKLDKIATQRGQSLAQMALSWCLRNRQVTSALIGASRPQQISENIKSVHQTQFSDEELNQIDQIISESK